MKRALLTLAIASPWLAAACNVLVNFPDVPDLATAGGADGSNGDGTSNGDGASNSDGPTDGAVGDAVVGPALPITLPTMTTASTIAASGTPGERHLLHADHYWSVYYIATNKQDIDAIVALDDVSPMMWSSPSQVVSAYPFGASSVDGRTFGLDVTPEVDGTRLQVATTSQQEVVNRGFTSGVLDPDSGIPFTANFSPLTLYTTVSADGTVTALAAGALPSSSVEVVQFGESSTLDASLVEVGAFDITDHGFGGGDSFSGPRVTLDPTVATVQTRAALPLGTGVAVIWLVPGSGLRSATRDTTWSLANVVSGSVGTITREWAACAGPAPAGSVHVIWASGGTFGHDQLDSLSGSWVGEPVPPPLDGVHEVFLACGTNDVFAFTVVSTATTGVTFPVNSILVSSWDGNPSSSFTPWTVAVAATGAGTTRCFLSGFDRVVAGGAPDPGPHVGLLWDESTASTCANPEQPALTMAVVGVPPG